MYKWPVHHSEIPRHKQKPISTLHTGCYPFEFLDMPTTRPRPTQAPSKESIRTAIIVGLIISLLGVIVLTYLLYQRRLRRNVKAGKVIGKREVGGAEWQNRARRMINDEQKGLEVGVVREPLPVYTRYVERGEKRLEMGMAR